MKINGVHRNDLKNQNSKKLEGHIRGSFVCISSMNIYEIILIYEITSNSETDLKW